MIAILIAIFLTAVFAGLMILFIRGALLVGNPRTTSKSGQELSIVGHSGELPSVSVIVPLRNEEVYAPATLEALMLQDYAGDWEVICVDDRSEDGTAEILRGFCARNSRF